MSDIFHVPSNIYFNTGYLIKIIYLENLILLFALVICQFKQHFFKKSSYKFVLQASCVFCSVNIFYFLPAILSAEMFVNLQAKTERTFYWNIPLYTNTPYISMMAISIQYIVHIGVKQHILLHCQKFPLGGTLEYICS